MSQSDTGAIDPNELVLRTAKAKAAALMASQEEFGDYDVLFTGDEVTIFMGRILEKPDCVEDAKVILGAYGEEDSKKAEAAVEKFILAGGDKCLSPNKVTTVSGMVLTNIKTGRQVEGVSTSCITFTKLPEVAIGRLLAEGECMHSSGALLIEDPSMTPSIQSIEGSYSAILGFPKELCLDLLQQMQDKMAATNKSVD